MRSRLYSVSSRSSGRTALPASLTYALCLPRARCSNSSVPILLALTVSNLRNTDIKFSGLTTREGRSILGQTPCANARSVRPVFFISQAEQKVFHGHIRSRCYRHRSRRLCLRDPRGATRHEGGRGGEVADVRRHLPEHRLHSVEGAAAGIRAVRGSEPRAAEDGRRGRQTKTRSSDHDEIQDRRRRRQHQGRRLPVQEEQDRSLSGHRAHRRHRQGRGEGGRRQDGNAGDQEHRHRHRLRCRETERHRDRREAHHLVDRRAAARQGPGKDAGDRRRRDRARAWLGVAAARIGSRGGGIPRPHSSGHGRRRSQNRSSASWKSRASSSSSAPRSPRSTLPEKC